jgi:hypothetical protein
MLSIADVPCATVALGAKSRTPEALRSGSVPTPAQVRLTTRGDKYGPARVSKLHPATAGRRGTVQTCPAVVTG